MKNRKCCPRRRPKKANIFWD